MQICTLIQTYNDTSTPPLSFLQARCPSCHPTNSIKALKGKPNSLTPHLSKIIPKVDGVTWSKDYGFDVYT